MDLMQHYESYRDSFKKTMLKNYDKKLKETPCQEVFPTLWDEVSHLITTIKVRIQGNDEEGYLKTLRRHRDLMLKLFKDMARPYSTYDGLTNGPVSAKEWHGLLDDWGWDWFRYTDCPGLKYTLEGALTPTVHVVPLYDETRRSFWNDSVPCFDAQEMRWISTFTNTSDVEAVIKIKLNHSGVKIWPEDYAPIQVSVFNHNIIKDWALTF